MRISSASLRRRISRSLVTVLGLTLIQTVALPVVNPVIANAYTQGTVTNGTAYGGTGGGANAANQNCTNGAIVAIGATKSGDNLDSFMFVCKTINNNATLSATEVTTNVFRTPAESDRCAAGQIGIGVRVIASNGGTLVGGVGLICGNIMSRANQDTRSIMPNASSAGTVYTFTCGTGQLLAGFALRTGSLVDQIIPKCSTFTAFDYAAVGAPTATLSGTSASVSFAAVTGSIADTPLTYTVSAVPNIGSTITVTGSTSPITVTGLAYHANYTFTVTASNAFGSSPATGSASGSLVMPGGETDTAFAVTGSQYGWVADTGTGGIFDIRGAITVQAWVYPTESTAGTQYSVVTKSEAYQLFHIDGVWKYSLQGGSAWGNGISTLIPVELNEWHHIAFTRAAGTNEVNFYYDGVLVFTGSANGAASSTIADSAFPFAVGGMAYNGPTLQYGFKGRIDNVAILDTVRDAPSILFDMHNYISPITSGLRFFYDMNEGSGSTLINRAATAVPASDLAIIGTPTFPDVKEASVSGSYNVLKFPRSYITSLGGWKVPTGISTASALIVAGGGGGGSRVGGGGGAGALLYQPSISLSAGTIEAITIGQGGIGGKTGNIVANNYQGVNGQETLFGLRFTLLGGGGGGGYNTASNTGHEGKSGGSGGGAAPHFSTAGTWPAGIGTTNQNTTYGYGLGFNGGSGFSGTGGYYPAGGGGGSAGVGATASSNSAAGNGGAGTLDPILGTTTCYAGGGGGGVGNLFSGTIGGAGGTCSGGVTTAGNGSKNEVIGGSAVANSGSGGGGSGYQSGSNNSTDKAGGHGGSGVIIIKFILTTTKPIFVGPSNDTTTAGLTETFTVSGDAIAPMVRSYLWQVSTDTGTSWSTPTQGSGWFTNSYVTPVLTTSMSGLRYQYRVVVTDTDTAGSRIVDTSTAVFLIINPALTMTGNTLIQKAINVSKVETYTVTGGTASYRYSLTPTIAGISLDTTTSLAPVIRISETRTVGTFSQTLSVIDSVSAMVSLQLTIEVIAPPLFSASADQVISGTIVDLDPGSTASYIGTGSSWKDLSGRSANASLMHAFGTTATYADGSSRANASFTNLTCNSPNFNDANFGSFEFSTIGQCIYATNSIPVATVNPVPVYTVSTWLKRNGDQAAWRSIVCNPYRFVNDQIIFCLFWASATTLNAGVFNGGSWYQTTAVSVPNQTWVYATVTYNGSNLLNLYLNDIATAYPNNSISVTWAASKINTGLIIGRKWDATDTFNGSVGQIRAYDRILSTSEIAQNFNATKSRYLTTFNKRTQTKKYGTLFDDTYTVTSGLNAISVTLASNAQSAIKWDTSTARSTKLSLQESLTVGTYYETITATDFLGQSVYLPLTLTVTKADTLTVSMDTGTVVTFNGNPIVLFPKPVYKGLVGVDTLTVTTKFSSQTYTLSSTRPTNADTYTVIASDPVFTVGAASNYQAILYETSTAVINKARQAALNPSMYGAVVGSPFTLTLLGGSGDGAVTETLTGVSTAPNCAISNKTLTSSATTIQYCQVTFTKATSQNYLSESITVQIYFMVYVVNQPAGQSGGGATIGINGATSVTVQANAAPTITGVSTSGDMTFPLAITGAGFTASGAGTTTIKFWRNQVLAPGDFVIKSDTLIWAKQPAGATVGKVLVTNGNGSAVSEANFTPIVFNI